MKPVVSFIVPALDTERYVAIAVRSALAQTIREIEVIVVDDGSQDGTAGVVQKIAREDSRVVLLRRERPGGAAAARNLAIDNARGEWVAVLDSDDVIEPERTERLLALARSTNSQLVADNFIQFEDGTKRILSHFLPAVPTPFAFDMDLVGFIDTNAILGRRRSWRYLKPMITIEFLRRCSLRYDERLRVGEDFQLWAEALLTGARCVVLGEPLYLYRERTDSVSHSLCIQDLDELAAASERLRELAGSKSDLSKAIERYVRALGRARTVLRLAEATKDRRWPEAARIVSRPEMWPIIGQFVCEAIAERVDHLRKHQFIELSVECAQ